MSAKNELVNKKKVITNYIILFFLFLATILLTLYLCSCYEVYNKSKMEIPVIRDTLSEITPVELDHYIQENPSIVIYMCTANNINCRNYEKELKKLIKKEELNDDITYLNLSNVDQSEFINTFNKMYKYKVSLHENYPAFVIFEDAKVFNILQEKEGKLTIQKTKQFFDINKIGE